MLLPILFFTASFAKLIRHLADFSSRLAPLAFLYNFHQGNIGIKMVIIWSLFSIILVSRSCRDSSNNRMSFFHICNFCSTSFAFFATSGFMTLILWCTQLRSPSCCDPYEQCTGTTPSLLSSHQTQPSLWRRLLCIGAMWCVKISYTCS